MRLRRPRTTGGSKAAVLDVLQAVEGLRAFPNRGRSGRVQGTRELVLTRPFLAVYEVREEEVQLLRNPARSARVAALVARASRPATEEEL